MRILVTGGTGLVGSAIKDRFREDDNVIFSPSSEELDLLNREQVFDFFYKNEIDLVIHCAAIVGGVLANTNFPSTFIGKNLRMQINVFDAALQMRTPNLIFIGSSCVYPPNAPLPLKEESLLSGKFENSNRWYATAKVAGIMQVEAVRLQHGLKWFSVLPTNIYGPNDNFNLHSGHVVPSLLRKFAEAVKFELNSVKIWGTGTPMREFIYAKDVANAVIRLTQSDVYLKEPFIVNLGSGQEVSIRELAEILKDISGFTGEVIFDSSFPDGVNQKTLDSSLLGSTGFRPEFELRDGLKLTYDWVVNNFENLRISEVVE